MSLDKEYIRISQMISAITNNWGVFSMKHEVIKHIEKSAKNDIELGKQVKNFLKTLREIKRPEDYDEINAACSIYAEIHTYILFKERRIKLVKIPEKKGQQRPDFIYKIGSGDICFEVKHPDIVRSSKKNKNISHNQEIGSDGLDNKAYLESQGKGVHFTETEISPYNETAPSKRIDIFTKKVKGMVKAGQIKYKPCFLVIHLARLPLLTESSGCLLPVYCGSYQDSMSCVSGELWHAGFGKKNDTIYKYPEFEGKGNIDGELQENGILIDKTNLLGIIFIIQNLGGKEKIYSLKNTPKISELSKAGSISESDVEGIIYDISDAFNDKDNTQEYKHACEARKG